MTAQLGQVLGACPHPSLPPPLFPRPFLLLSRPIRPLLTCYSLFGCNYTCAAAKRYPHPLYPPMWGEGGITRARYNRDLRVLPSQMAA